VRYEEVSATFKAYNLLDGRDPQSQSFTEVAAEPKNHFLLPMVQVRYNPVEWADVRFAYSQTLARPDFYQLSPHYNIDYSHNNVWAGNPKLVPAHSYNQDVVLTFHGDKLGMFSVGGFTKRIDDFTYYMSYKLRDAGYPGFDSTGTYGALGSPPKDGATLYTYRNNPTPAYVTGLELDLQTRLWYLPFPLDGIVIGANYTRIWSHAKYALRDEVTHGRPGQPTYYIERIDSLREGRLVNQPNDIANAFIGYDYLGFSGKVSFVFQGNSVSSIGQYREQDGFTDDYYRVDVSVRQKLPIEGLQVFLDVNNTNNRQNIARQISIDGFTNQKNYGLTANLGVRYAFSLSE
jgi:TonB-dependent receptor